MDDFERRLSDALQQETGEADKVPGLAVGARRRARARRGRRRTSLGAVAVSAVVAAAVGGQWWTDRDSGADVGTFNDAPAALPDPMVTCGGADSWPASAMTQEPGGETAEQDARIREAFAELLREMPLEAPAELQDRGSTGARFVVLVDRADNLVVGVGDWDDRGPAPGARVLRFAVESDGQLTPAGGGDCRLQVATSPGQDRVELSAPKGGVERESRIITVLATERECTSGRDATPYLSDPEVVETDGQVSVLVTADEVAGNANCIGNRAVEVEVELAQPLGDRDLVDGGAWPPAPIG